MTDTADRATVLQQVSARIEQIESSDTQKNIAAAADILAGLVLDKEIIRKILRTDLMKESVIYQAIKEEGREEGAYFMALQMLSIKLGDLPEEVTTQVNQLSLAKLPGLGLATPSFESVLDLTDWLRAKAS